MQRLDTRCPKCGRKSLEKKYRSDGKYRIICSICGLSRGEFSPDKKKGVV